MNKRIGSVGILVVLSMLSSFAFVQAAETQDQVLPEIVLTHCALARIYVEPIFRASEFDTELSLENSADLSKVQQYQPPKEQSP
jgi:hypothetical protein